MGSSGYLATLRKSIAKNHRKMENCERQVLAGEVEPIHEFRVALRRIRSALRLITQVENDSMADKLRKKGGDFARVTGRVRDLDIHLEHARLDLGDGSAPEAWILALVAERHSAMEEVEAMLSRKRYTRWKKKLGLWLKSMSDDRPLKDCLEEAIQDHVEEVASGPVPDSDDEFHTLRIAIKRLRHLLEFFRKDLQPRAEEAIDKLSNIQDLLGKYHDAVVGLAKLDATLLDSGDLEIVGSLRVYRLVLVARIEKMNPHAVAEQAMEIVRHVGEIGV